MSLPQETIKITPEWAKTQQELEFLCYDLTIARWNDNWTITGGIDVGGIQGTQRFHVLDVRGKQQALDEALDKARKIVKARDGT